MPFFTDNIRAGASGAEEEYSIERSLRFNRSDQTILSKSLSTSPTNRKKTTVSLWVKRALLGTSQGVLTSAASGTGANQNATRIYFNSDDTMILQTAISNSNVWSVTTYRKFRDTNAWMHILVAIDTTQSTASNRVKLYINGVQETDFSSASYPSQNYDDYWAYGNYRIGDWGGDAGYYVGFEGYLAEIVQIDGQALDYTSFTEADAVTNKLKPKNPSSLTFGTNGFHLKFADNTGTSATTLGKDSSGVGNNFTPSNFSVSTGDGNDSKTDTPTLNKATLNSVTGFNYNATLTEGNLKMTGSSGFKEISTIAVAGTSKFYYEVVNTSAAGWQLVGVFVGQPNNPSNALSNTEIWGFASTQATYYGGSYTSTNDVPDWGNNDVVGIKYENGSLKLYKNGTLASASTSSVPTGDLVFDYIANDNTNEAAFVRFNSDSWTQDSAAGVDATWELSTSNLPDPAIKLPNKHFDTLLWTGNGSNGHAITGLEFQPDWVWIKNRSSGVSHYIVDSLRISGSNYQYLNSNETNAEGDASARFTSIDSNGFTLPSGGTFTNANNHNYVGWNWNAGGSTVTNNDGNNTSQVRANASAGFSIVSYTGNGTNNSNVTMGHGLGVKPDLVIIKNRDASKDWVTWHKNLGTHGTYVNNNIFLNGYAAQNYYSDQFREADASTFAVRSTDSNGNAKVNKSGDDYIAYVFSSVQGYSKFGKYTGNGNANGTFVYLGFKPAFVITRGLHGTSWYTYDNKRNTYNVVNKELNPNNSQSEATYTTMDFLSNGFKLRTSNDAFNYNNYTYIYIAFAESPFKYARAR